MGKKWQKLTRGRNCLAFDGMSSHQGLLLSSKGHCHGQKECMSFLKRYTATAISVAMQKNVQCVFRLFRRASALQCVNCSWRTGTVVPGQWERSHVFFALLTVFPRVLFLIKNPQWLLIGSKHSKVRENTVATLFRVDGTKQALNGWYWYHTRYVGEVLVRHTPI